MSLPRVLITGATGFIGAHIVHQALEAGYPVRITARPPKVQAMQKKYNGKVDIVAVADIDIDDLTDVLNDIGAVIHVAAGLPWKQDAEAMYNSAINGAMNVLKHVLAAQIPRIVITSSFVTTESFADKSVWLRDRVYTDQDWNSSTEEQIRAGGHDGFWLYTAVKTLAERQVWKFADEHPELDITTINPCLVLGPFAPGTEIAPGDFHGFASSGILLQEVLSNKKLPPLQLDVPPQTIDVRDVAKAHILALKSPLTSESQVGKKRILMTGPIFLWKDAVELLYETRPAYRDRLSDASEAIKTDVARADNSRAKEVLGLTEFTDWRDTVQDTADALTEIMKGWA